MGHKHETQPHSEDVARHQHLFRRGGVWYGRRRIPTDLLEVPEFRGKKEIKKSLKTTDLATAKRLAETLNIEFTIKFDEQRKNLKGQKQPSDNNGGEKRKWLLSSLSELERQNFVRRFFVLLEKNEERQRRTDSDDERVTAIETLREDLGAYESGPAVIDWKANLEKEFEAQGIECDDFDIADEMADWLKRAHVVSKKRTLVALGGGKLEPEYPLFKDWNAFSPLAEAGGSRRTVSELCEAFREQRRSAGAKPATMKSYNLPVRVLEEFMSPSQQITSVKYEDAKSVVEFLSKIPVHADKYYPKLSLALAAEKEEQTKARGTLSPNRQHDVFTTIKGIFGYAVDREWLDKNPFGSKTLVQRLPKLEESEKEQITGAELTKLLSSSDFLRERNHKGPDGERREGRFWAVLLCVFHGFRANESASLLVSDVKESDGINYLNLSETDEERKKVKSLKTKVSRRNVPLHEGLLKAGFLEYVEQRRHLDLGGRLFPEFKPTPGDLHNFAKGLSKWFNALRKTLLGKPIKMGDKSLRSLRDAFADAVRAVTDSDEIRYQLGGWTTDMKKNAGWGYGKGYPLSKLKEVIDQIKFPGFDPSFLYPLNAPTKKRLRE